MGTAGNKNKLNNYISAYLFGADINAPPAWRVLKTEIT
jgi:hypothetical protein